MKRRLSLALLVAVCATGAHAAPAWRVQQSCALKRYLGATPAFANTWGRDASQVSEGNPSAAVWRIEPAARFSYTTAIASGRAFADRAADLLARRERITREEALRVIGADPGPWPDVTAAKCDDLERRAAR
ncbi:hypothetical protein [Phenylobacterium sp.]|uniref:hypothetical protein n=1 Tax=Phenylobacterium sp. TaxID=1871053 RepID=UPI0030F37BFD